MCGIFCTLTTKNVSVLVALAVNQEGYREIVGVAEGMKEDKASWLDFLRYLKKRGLKDPCFVLSDNYLGLVDALTEVFAKTLWQRCMVHFYRNVWKVIPQSKIGEVSALLKAIHAQHKTQLIIQKLKAMKLAQAAKVLEKGIEDTFSFYAFPREHPIYLRTNNPLERIMKEIRRRTRVVGSFPDGHSALMLACARPRHITSSKWGQKRYLNMDKLTLLQLNS
ncbi:MAG: transposase [Verrucomicrobiota bacterium]